MFLFLANRYKELNNKLLAALQKRDATGLAKVLKYIDRCIQKSQIPPADREQLEKARALLEKLESRKRIQNMFT